MSRCQTRFKDLPTAVAGWMLAGLALLAGGANPAAAQPPPQPRSVVDLRERAPDVLDRPRHRERWTHRGWHLRTDVLDVVANTSVADARWTLAQSEQAWADTAALADHWMTSHRRADFALGTVQIFVDGEQPRDRDGPLTTLDVVGPQIQIHLHVSSGQPPLEQQLLRLREATALALLHTAEVDRQLPPWVCAGLATYIARQGAPPNSPAENKAELGGQQWRWTRATPDALATPAHDSSYPAAQIEFLLAGNDAVHTLAFFRAVEQSIAEPPRPSAVRDPVDELALATRAEFIAWQQDPQIGQPLFVPAADATPELLAVKQQMLLALKLLRRFPAGPSPQVLVKVTAFDREKGEAVVVGGSVAAPPSTLEDLFLRLTHPHCEPWATLDPRGNLLLSTQPERLRELLGVDDNRFRIERSAERLVVSTQLTAATVLQGWLEENQDNPRRPLAKFAVVKAPGT